MIIPRLPCRRSGASLPIEGQRRELYHTPPERATARREKSERAAPPDSSQHQTRQAVRRGNLSGKDSGKPQPFDRAPVYPPPSNAATYPATSNAANVRRPSAFRRDDRGEHRTPRRIRRHRVPVYPASRGEHRTRQPCATVRAGFRPKSAATVRRLSAVRPSAPDSGQYQRQPWRPFDRGEHRTRRRKRPPVACVNPAVIYAAFTLAAPAPCLQCPRRLLV